jgi:TrmH family RNA methyltransferase
MISRKALQYYSSLLKKKYRKTENKFIVEGKKSVLEGLNSSYKCEIIFTTNKFIENNGEIKNRILKKKVKIEILKQDKTLT